MSRTMSLGLEPVMPDPPIQPDRCIPTAGGLAGNLMAAKMRAREVIHQIQTPRGGGAG